MDIVIASPLPDCRRTTGLHKPQERIKHHIRERVALLNIRRQLA